MTIVVTSKERGVYDNVCIGGLVLSYCTLEAETSAVVASSDQAGVGMPLMAVCSRGGSIASVHHSFVHFQ